MKWVKYCFTFIIIIMIMSISNNVYATTSVEDFLCDVTYVSEEDTPLINAENAVSWVRAFLDVKYDAKQDDDTDAKNLAKVCNKLLERLDSSNKAYSADIYSSCDTANLIEKINNKVSEFQNEAEKANKTEIANQFKTVKNTTGENAKKNTEERNKQEAENKEILTGENSFKTSDVIYSQPKKNDTKGAGQSIDDVMNDADKFINQGEIKYKKSLSNVSNTIYNILLTIGVVIAVLVGAIMGIKLMLSSVEEKAEVKKLLIPYVVGCIIIFGGFGIWKLVVTILQGV